MYVCISLPKGLINGYISRTGLQVVEENNGRNGVDRVDIFTILVQGFVLQV